MSDHARTASATDSRHKTRRFAGRLTLLMVVGFVLANAAVNAYRSDLQFGATLLTNLLAAFSWLLPWVAVIVLIGFLATLGVLRLGDHGRGTIEWWRGGLAAFFAAAMIATAHFGLNSWTDLLVSVRYTNDGQATEALARILISTIFVGWSTIAGIVLPLIQKSREGRALRRQRFGVKVE